VKSSFKCVILGIVVLLVIAGCGPKQVPEPRNDRELKKAIDNFANSICRTSLEWHAFALRRWAADHEGQLPLTLSELGRFELRLLSEQEHDLPDGWSELIRSWPYAGVPSTFVCPCTGHQPGNMDDVEEWTDYVYIWVPGLDQQRKPVLLMYDKDGNHEDGRHELYTDSTVKWKPAPEEQLLTPQFATGLRAHYQE
jgi:hypothetical protein